MGKSYDKPLCIKCGKEKEPQRVGKYSYCLKCQGEFTKESTRRMPYHKYSETRKIQHLCRLAVYKAIKNGELIKTPCEVCGGLPSEAHHTDYTKPLQVRWLCRGHHADQHRSKPRKKPPQKLLQVHFGANSKVAKPFICAGLVSILDKETASFKAWQETGRHFLNPTRQKEKDAQFRKRINAFRITIAALSVSA